MVLDHVAYLTTVFFQITYIAMFLNQMLSFIFLRRKKQALQSGTQICRIVRKDNNIQFIN